MAIATTSAADPGTTRRGGNPWVGFAARRLARFALSIALLVTATFWMIHLVPGDPARAALGATASAELVEHKRAELHLDEPLHEQFAIYLGGLVRGDLGSSQVTGLPVGTVIGDRLPATVTLAAVAFLLVVVVAVPGGMAAGQATWRRWRPASELAFSARRAP